MDFTGQSYGSWKILHREGTTKCGFVTWLSECKCGKRECLISIQIASGKARKECGCSSSWIGKRFGKLVVIEKIGDKGNHASNILCKCDCGIEKVVWGGSLHAGTVQSCGCYRRRSNKHKSVVVILSTYIGHARKRGIGFNLTQDEFENLILKDCFYCGNSHCNILTRKTINRSTMEKGHTSFSYNGIDRYDNDKGYDIKNCVPCCKLCNMMKRHLHVDVWKKHMKKVLEYSQEQKRLQTAGV